MEPKMEPKIDEIKLKIQREQKVLEGANKMLQLASDENSQQLCLVNIQEAHSRIVYLQGRLNAISGEAKISSPQKPIAIMPTMITKANNSMLGEIMGRITTSFGAKKPEPQAANKIGSNSALDPESAFPLPETNFDFLKFGNALTSEQLKFRLQNVRVKLDLEKKVKSGTENLLAALANIPDQGTRKSKPDLEEKINEANFKINVLTKAEHKYRDLLIETNDINEEDIILSDSGRDRRTGRLKIKLVGAINLSNRKSAKDDIVAVIKIDGLTKHVSKPSKGRWDESVNLQVDRALELELLIREKSGAVLAVLWFKISDYVDHYEKLELSDSSGKKELEDEWLDLEPSGQMSIKMSFIGNSTKAEKDRVFRREAVQKIYPKNGHRFVVLPSYQVMQCAICSEFMGRTDYQCPTCAYSIHAKCHHRVITKCIDSRSPEYSKLSKEDQNTGQLLKYNIPHRWEGSTNIAATWCGHCGIMISPARRVHKCSECNKVSHKHCSNMIPPFCGLAPAMADQLVAGLEDIERRRHKKELEEAENARKTIRSETLKTDSSIGEQKEDKIFEILGHVSQPHMETEIDAMMSISDQVEVSKPAVKMTLDDFKLLSVLGRGAFGKVMLVADNATNSYYAMKALKKEFLVQNDDIQSTKLEKAVFQIASTSRHPFLVNLHSCFHSEDRVYFVMEYVQGGDLMTLIQEVRRFTSIKVKFYACEILLALEYLHMNNIIYRDLKLDNVLLCADGHIKVADYGICKAGIGFGDLTSTFCGTPDYMAVEILLNKKYGSAVDWWSFGIIIYVMLIGKYPYHGEDENQILEAILSDAIEFPPAMPPTTLSLIHGLLNKNPARRLGGGSEDAEEIRRHPYFMGVDWNSILQKKVPPPYVPTIDNPEDVSNFDPTFTVEEPILTPTNTILNEDDQKDFEGFDFVSEWAANNCQYNN